MVACKYCGGQQCEYCGSWQHYTRECTVCEHPSSELDKKLFGVKFKCEHCGSRMCGYCGSREHRTNECPECEHCGSVERDNPFDQFGLEMWYDEVIRSGRRKLADAAETVPGYSTFAKSQWTSELERMWALPTKEGG